ncbi:MAG TPA: hypothetical protein PLN92_05460 [Thermotogota bacterium]|nr:hypothetical protein [Thermotogota bacterium]
MAEKHNEMECHYLIDKPNRDRVRETVWNKIVNVDSRVETLNEYMTAQLEATARYNEDQDKRLEELKALIQEAAAVQSETDKKIESFEKHLNNGWKTKFMEELTDRLFKMLEVTGGQLFGLKTKQEELKVVKIEKSKIIWLEIFKVVGTVLGTGGIVMALMKG